MSITCQTKRSTLRRALGTLSEGEFCSNAAVVQIADPIGRQWSLSTPDRPTGADAPKSANGMVRPCSCPASKRSSTSNAVAAHRKGDSLVPRRRARGARQPFARVQNANEVCRDSYAVSLQGASTAIMRFSTSMKSLDLLQKFVSQKWLDQDRNIVCSNRLYGFGPDVTGHDDGGNIPVKSGTQGLDGLNAID